jgi:hypothetical protein
VRRRNIAYREDIAGAAVRIAGAEVATDRLLTRLDRLGLRVNLTSVLDRATPAARLEVENLLDSPRFADSPTLTAAAIGELSRTETLDKAAALRTAAVLTDRKVGAGLTKVEATTDIATKPEALQAIAATSDWKKLDTATAAAPVGNVPSIATNLTGVTVAPTRITPAVAAPARIGTTPPSITTPIARPRTTEAPAPTGSARATRKRSKRSTTPKGKKS